MDKIQQIKCIHCGSLSPATNAQCWKCNKKLKDSLNAAKSSKNDSEDTSPELEHALSKGASIVSKGDGYVTVRYPKKFNWGLFILLFILGIILSLFYLIYYAGCQPKQETFQTNKSGKTPVAEKIVVKCLKCGTKNDEDAGFCKKCASKLSSDADRH